MHNCAHRRNCIPQHFPALSELEILRALLHSCKKAPALVYENHATANVGPHHSAHDTKVCLSPLVSAAFGQSPLSPLIDAATATVRPPAKYSTPCTRTWLSQPGLWVVGLPRPSRKQMCRHAKEGHQTVAATS